MSRRPTSNVRRASRPRRRVTALLATVAQLGYAHGFFGEFYEAVVKVPDRLAGAYEPGG